MALPKEYQEAFEDLARKKKLYVEVFESPAGKEVLEDLKKHVGAEKTIFDKNPQQMAFNEGQRTVYLHIKHMMVIDLEGTKKNMEKQIKEMEEDNV